MKIYANTPSQIQFSGIIENPTTRGLSKDFLKKAWQIIRRTPDSAKFILAEHSTGEAINRIVPEIIASVGDKVEITETAAAPLKLIQHVYDKSQPKTIVYRNEAEAFEGTWLSMLSSCAKYIKSLGKK